MGGDGTLLIVQSSVKVYAQNYTIKMLIISAFWFNILLQNAVFCSRQIRTQPSYRFFKEPLVPTRFSRKELRTLPASNRGIELDVSQKYQFVNEVTICFDAALDYARPSCLFEVAGIQFTLIQPLNPAYGQIRFTHGSDRTVIFRPDKSFQVKN